MRPVQIGGKLARMRDGCAPQRSTTRDAARALPSVLGTRERSRVRLPRLTQQMALRMAADVIMVNAALVVALALRFLWLVGVEQSGKSPWWTLHHYLLIWVTSAWILTGVCLIVFSASGFYTRGRFYSGRYKALTIAQAVTLSYLAYGAATYLLGSRFSLPRSVALLAWVLTLTLLIGARLWALLWMKVAGVEQRALPPADRKIHTVLVIGGDGYIGSALLPMLLARGYRVRVLGLFLYGTDPLASVLGHPRLELLRADFRQVHKVVEAMRDVDAVVHLGGIVGDPACALDEELTVDINLMATRMIAEVAKGHGVNRFVFASTCSVYGASDVTLDEQSALRPVSLYARSKAACERVLLQMADEDFAPVNLRFGTVYGLSGRVRFDLVVNLLTAKAAVDGQITVAGGDQWRPFLHVEDAAAAVLRVLEAPLPLVRNQVFNVGADDQNYTILDVARLIQRRLPDAVIQEVQVSDDRRNYRVDFGKIRGELGFTARWTLDAGIQQVMEAVVSGRVGDYRDPKYSNVKFLSEEGLPLLVRPDKNWAYQLLNEPFAEPESEARWSEALA